MIRGTTPTHVFTIPFDTALIKELKVVYAQDDIPLVFKKKTDCVFNERQIILSLTQEDTFLFDSEKPVELQLRVLTNDNKALNSKVKKISVGKCLDSEVLS